MGKTPAQIIAEKFPTGPCVIRYNGVSRAAVEVGVHEVLVLGVYDHRLINGQIVALYIDPLLGNETRKLIRNTRTENGSDTNAYDQSTFAVLKDGVVLPLPHADNIRIVVEKVVNDVRDGFVDRHTQAMSSVNALTARVEDALVRLESVPSAAALDQIRLDLAAVRLVATQASEHAEAALESANLDFTARETAMKDQLDGMSARMAAMAKNHEEMRTDLGTLVQAMQDQEEAEARQREVEASAPMTLDQYSLKLSTLGWLTLCKESKDRFGIEIPKSNPEKLTAATLKARLVADYAKRLKSQA